MKPNFEQAEKNIDNLVTNSVIKLYIFRYTEKRM